MAVTINNKLIGSRIKREGRVKCSKVCFGRRTPFVVKQTHKWQLHFFIAALPYSQFIALDNCS